MPSTKALRERRGQLRNRFNEIINRAESEDRDITTGEQRELDMINDEDAALENRIERQEDLARRNLESAQPIDRRGSGFSGWGQPGNVPTEASALDLTVSAFVKNAHGIPVDPKEWDAAERSGHRPGASGIDFVLNRFRPTVGRSASFFGSPSNSMSTFNPGKGGTLVPLRGFGPALEMALKDEGPMLAVSEVWTTEDGVERPYPMVDDTGEEGVLVAELEDSPEGDILSAATMFRAHKLSSKIVRVSQELLEDTPLDIATEVGKALGLRLGRGANRLLTLGDTANAPRGIVPSAFVGKETASPTAISADEILDLIASVDPVYRNSPSCAFMMHGDVFASIAKLRDLEGRFLLGDLEFGANAKIRGFPVVINNAMSGVLAAGVRSILFGELSKFKVRLVRQIRLRTLNELYAKSDEVGFLGFMRFDGALLDAGTHPVKCLVQKAA